MKSVRSSQKTVEFAVQKCANNNNNGSGSVRTFFGWYIPVCCTRSAVQRWHDVNADVGAVDSVCLLFVFYGVGSRATHNRATASNGTMMRHREHPSTASPRWKANDHIKNSWMKFFFGKQFLGFFVSTYEQVGPCTRDWTVIGLLFYLFTVPLSLLHKRRADFCTATIFGLTKFQRFTY